MSPAGTVTDPPFTQRCNRWSQSSPGFSGRIGANLAVTSAWTDSTQNAIPCDNQFGALYCFEQSHHRRRRLARSCDQPPASSPARANAVQPRSVARYRIVVRRLRRAV